LIGTAGWFSRFRRGGDVLIGLDGVWPHRSSRSHAIWGYRLAHWLWDRRHRLLARLLSEVTRILTGVDIASARRAEELGLDAVALGERHAGPFLSSGVTVLLGAIAASTSRVRIMTGVAVLSILDPLRVAEDYATIDQLSRGRVELVIGKATRCASCRCSASGRASSGSTRGEIRAPGQVATGTGQDPRLPRPLSRPEHPRRFRGNASPAPGLRAFTQRDRLGVTVLG
jgi:hypothetical protein